MTDDYSLVYQSSNAFTERIWVNLAYSSEARVSLMLRVGVAQSHRFRHQLRLCLNSCSMIF